MLGTCDRCVANAQHRVELTNGDLVFCGHHFRQHEVALLEAMLIDVPVPA